MKCISKKSGFTLAELMVVVAILGILVTISIAVFGNHSGESEKAVCDANKTALMQHIDMDDINDFSLIQTATQEGLEAKLLSAEEAMESDWHCPTGGTYTLSFRDQYDPDSWYIYCSYHDGGEKVKELVNVGIDDDSMKLFIDALNQKITTNVDSTANSKGVMTDNVKKIRAILEDLKINPDSDIITSWKYTPSNSGKMLLYMSGIDIRQLEVGYIFPVLKYSEQYKGFSVWICTVQEKKASGILVEGKKYDNLVYNIIGTQCFEITDEKYNADSSYKTLFSNVKPIYDKVLNLYNSNPEEFQNYTTAQKIREKAGISSK